MTMPEASMHKNSPTSLSIDEIRRPWKVAGICSEAEPERMHNAAHLNLWRGSRVLHPRHQTRASQCLARLIAVRPERVLRAGHVENPGIEWWRTVDVDRLAWNLGCLTVGMSTLFEAGPVARRHMRQ